MARKKFFQIKYPKFFLLFCTFILAYIIFQERHFAPFHDFLFGLGYVGTFFAGMMFTYGFTSGPAIATFLILGEEQNIPVAAFIGGLGALIGDLTIFRFIRHSFHDELKKLSREKFIRFFNKIIPRSIQKVLLPFLGALIIASPLPDELGVTLLATSSVVSGRGFTILSFVMNTLGILVMMYIGKSIA